MVKVALKAMRILQEVSRRDGEAVRLSELATASGENASTCAGIVKTLTDAGFLRRDPIRGYRLGVLTASLLYGSLYSEELLLRAEQVMPDAARENGVYLSLAVLRDNVRHSILEVNESGGVVMQASANPNVFNSATGLMLASYLPSAKLDALLEIYTLPRRFADATEFRNALYLIRAQGMCELLRPGNRLALAVPVVREGVLLAALGCHLTEERAAADVYGVLKVLRETAQKLAVE